MRQISSGILFSILILMVHSGCIREKEKSKTVSTTYYTCPMHPSVVSKTPGACPVCNMSLIKMDKNVNQHATHQGNFIVINEHQQKLAGIQTDTVRLRSIASASSIIGVVTVDEELIKTISSPIKGRIDKLFIKTTGVYLKSGSAIYSIYSEQLLADEIEFLSLLEKSKSTENPLKPINELVLGARNKLLLWGLTEKQITDLEKSGHPSRLMTFYSPSSGYVSEMNITEGMYVEEGSILLKITSLNQVWVEAQIYSNEVSGIESQKLFQLFSESNPGEMYNGTLVYNNPIVEEGKRIHLLKIRVDNSEGKLIPGTLVSVIPEKSSVKVLAVPKSSVLLEKMKTVWVLAHDNTFEQRMVETGVENNYWIEILSGLKEGEIVVTDGAYLISSEFILKSGAGQRHEH